MAWFDKSTPHFDRSLAERPDQKGSKYRHPITVHTSLRLLSRIYIFDNSDSLDSINRNSIAVSILLLSLNRPLSSLNYYQHLKILRFKPILQISMTELGQRKLSLSERISLALRPKKPHTKLRKKSEPSLHKLPSNLERKPEGKRLQTGAIYRPTSLDNFDEQTGERRDDTDLLHGLAQRESNESLDLTLNRLKLIGTRPQGENDIAKLPSALWVRICRFLEPCDTASLAFSSKTLLSRLGPGPWEALYGKPNREQRIQFLIYLDEQLPAYLLCFLCGTYHLRTQIGNERLRPTSVLNLLYSCPSLGKPGLKPPRARITPAHTLPFTFVQLALRAHRFSPNHGIPSNALERRYSDHESEWSHQTRYYVHKNHLLLRVTSRSFASPNLPPSGLRHLLYNREDYTPYFSCCTHWRDGELMNVCKCALSHIPERRLSVAEQLRSGPQIQLLRMNPSAIVSLCSFCRPMHRCPECPTEYLVELKLGEDKNEVDPGRRFKQIIVVTRWSDLGDGTSPRASGMRRGGEWGGEWGSITGEEGIKYRSFERMGKRAISGIFEAQSGVTLPGQRLISLNPKMQKLGEEGDN